MRIQCALFALALLLCGVAVARQSSDSANQMANQAATTDSADTSATSFVRAQTLGQQLNLLAARQSEALTTPEVQEQIQQRFGSEPSLAGVALGVKTDDQSVVLTGNVGDAAQHALVIDIAKLFAGNRQIEDNLIVKR